MSSPRFAAIDVGTNSVLLLVAERQRGGGFQKVEERMELTRLGKGVDESGRLDPEAMEATLRAAQGFAKRARELGAEGLAVTATSAARDAENGKAFLEALGARTGTVAEILSGEEEATLTFSSVAQDFGDGPIVAIDIGGGSTEVIFGSSGKVEDRRSFDLGSVRLTERWLHSDPPRDEELDALRRDARAILSRLPTPPPEATMVGIAGTVTTLCALHLGLSAYDGGLVHGRELRLADVRALASRLGGLTLRERLALPGLPEKRADVIVAGAEILVAAMERLSFSSVVVSDKGVRWGLLRERFSR